MSVLVLCEHVLDTLTGETRSTIAASLSLGLPVDLLVIGQGCKAVLEEARAIAGIRAVLHAPLPSPQLAEPLADCVVAIADNYALVVAAATSFGKNVMPRIAALADIPQISDVTSIVDARTFERPIYAGNAFETVELRGERAVLTIRATAFEPAQDSDAAAMLKELELPTGPSISEVLDVLVTRSDRPELSSAEVVVSGGRAFASREEFERLLTPLAAALGAAIGASRAAVDAGYTSNDLQVGQTGKIVAPRVYLALGISGALQHLAGMKDSKTIFAINKDADAAIFAVSDYYMVGDLFKILPELTSALS